MRALLTVAYDGTAYCGWQRQNNDISIQQLIEEAISPLYGKEIKILGASRTDSGVHALGQRASFLLPDERIAVDRLYLAINSRLPEDIRIVASEAVEDSFHVISNTKNKTYVYKIQNSEVANPLTCRYSWHVREDLDLDAMERAAKAFMGRHDFRGFCSSNSGAQTFVREIYDIKITEINREISIEIRGNGFLYNMVRIITGTLADVGTGRLKPSEIPEIIESLDRKRAGKTAPAKGLTLVRVEY